MFENIIPDIVLHECEKSECTREQKRTLTSLTFRFDSGMRDAWKSIDSEDPDRYYKIIKHKVHVAYYRGKIVGWALSLFEEGDKCPRSMFYVNKRFRRKKVGTFLLNRIRDLYSKEPFVYRSESDCFFSANGISTRRII